MRAHSRDIAGRDGQPIVRIEERSIDVAEEGNCWKWCGAQRTGAHGRNMRGRAPRVTP